MNKDFVWNNFERTGDINAYLHFKKFEEQKRTENCEAISKSDL